MPGAERAGKRPGLSAILGVGPLLWGREESQEENANGDETKAACQEVEVGLELVRITRTRRVSVPSTVSPGDYMLAPRRSREKLDLGPAGRGRGARSRRYSLLLHALLPRPRHRRRPDFAHGGRCFAAFPSICGHIDRPIGFGDGKRAI